MDVQLIELVRWHEELYNLADKRYSDNDHKRKLWREIAAHLHKSPEYCKKRWESLRAQFRKICRKPKTGQSLIKKWKYEDELSFLLPHMKDKGRPNLNDESNVNVDSMSEENEDLIDDDLKNEEDIKPLNISQNTALILSKSSHSPNISNASVGNVGSTSFQDRKRCRKIRKKYSVAGPETAGSTLMKYILDQKKKERSSEEKDALDFFFEGIKQTMNTFSPGDKYLAKVKIFNIVSEIEAKYVNIDGNCQDVSQHPFQCEMTCNQSDCDIQDNSIHIPSPIHDFPAE